MVYRLQLQKHRPLQSWKTFSIGLVFFFLSLLGAGSWTENFTTSRQVLHHRALFFSYGHMRLRRAEALHCKIKLSSIALQFFGSEALSSPSWSQPDLLESLLHFSIHMSWAILLYKRQVNHDISPDFARKFMKLPSYTLQALLETTTIGISTSVTHSLMA